MFISLLAILGGWWRETSELCRTHTHYYIYILFTNTYTVATGHVSSVLTRPLSAEPVGSYFLTETLSLSMFDNTQAQQLLKNSCEEVTIL